MPVGRSGGGVRGNGARGEDGGTSPRRQEPHAVGGNRVSSYGARYGLIRISAGEGTARSRSPSLAEWARASRSYSRDERGRLSHAPSPSLCAARPSASTLGAWSTVSSISAWISFSHGEMVSSSAGAAGRRRARRSPPSGVRPRPPPKDRPGHVGRTATTPARAASSRRHGGVVRTPCDGGWSSRRFAVMIRHPTSSRQACSM